MFLNEFGRPVALNAFEAGKLELPDNPIIVTGINASLDNIPANWTGTIYSNEYIVAEIKKNLSDDLQRRATFQACHEAECHAVSLPGGKQIYLSLYGLSKFSDKVVIFLIEDGIIRSLATGEAPNMKGCFSISSSLRNIIETGIDLVFFDDTVYLENSPEELAKFHPNKEQVKHFVSLVRPTTVIGYYGAFSPETYINSVSASFI